MKLTVENIYSEEGRKAVIDAYTKSMWAASVNFASSWCGVQLLQTPEDMVMLSELIWKNKPDLVVECGIYRGGGLILYASILQLLGKGEVIGIDVDTSKAEHVKTHPLGSRISIIKADTGAPETAAMIADKAKKAESVMVILDSDHSAAHVKKEMNCFAPFIKPGGYLVVLDGIMTILHDVPGGAAQWKSDNPETAIKEFLQDHPEFERDWDCNKLGTSHGPGGYLKRK